MSQGNIDPERAAAVQQWFDREKLLEMAWGIIANAGGGDWSRESKEWQKAAAQWRDNYFNRNRT